MGKFKGQVVSYEELIDSTSELDEVIVHSGEIDFDEDDNVLLRNFEDGFDAIENLLELPQLMDAPNWLEQINGNNVSCKSWSLESALEAALVAACGQVYWVEQTVTVGYVSGDEISRKCKIATRLAEC